MYLKQLELTGFKSFVGRTRLQFGPGITAIVGPNGSGKSNVADAVRWVLGEQSARALRGRRGEDVIFAGGGRRHPVGMAEVSLLLDNADERVPLPYAEIAVARRLYRSGESEYLVNGSRVRLRDVTEWMLGAGLGPDSYCVVGQGTIEQLVLQRPEERRLLLEDAADVRRHALRLAEAERDLAATAVNLERARDLAAALGPEVDRLRVAARRAERRTRIVAEVAALARTYYGAALAAAEARASLAASTLASATLRRTGLEAELALIDATRTADEAARRPRDARLAALRERSGRLRAERERLLREQAVAHERLAAAEGRHADRAAQAAILAERVETAAVEATRLAAEAEAVGGRRATAATTATSAQSTVQEASKRLAAARTEEDRARQAIQEGQTQEHRLEERLRLAAARREAAATTLDALAARVEQARAGVANAEAAATALAEASGAAQARRDAARATVEQARAARAAADAALVAARQEGQATQMRVSDVLARRAALERVLAAAPELAATADLGTDGPRQLLGTLLQVDAAYQPAVAAALDAAARHVVVAERDGALAGLRLLAERDGPRVVFAALSGGDGQRERAAEQFRAATEAALADVKGWRLALDLVSADAAHQGLCARYLGTTVVVEKLAVALVVHERLLSCPECASEFQVVTQDGVVIRSAGEWAAGRDGRDAHLLAYQREVRGLAAEETTAAEAAKAAARRQARAEAAAAAAVAGEETAREAQATADAGRRDAEQAERLAGHELATARRELARLEAERAAEEQAQAALAADAARLTAERATLVEQAGPAEAALQDAAASALAAEDAVRRATEAEAHARTALAVATADKRAAGELAGRANAEARRLAAEHEALLRQAAEADAAARALAAEQGRLDERLAALAAELSPLQSELHTLQDVAEAAAAERQRLDEAARRLQRELRAADESHNAATVASERTADSLAALRREQAALWADLGAIEGAPAAVQLALVAADGSVGARVPSAAALSRQESGRGAAPPAAPLSRQESEPGASSSGPERPEGIASERRAGESLAPGPGEGDSTEEIAAASAVAAPPIDLDDLARRLAAKQRELRVVGAVDPAAAEEYQAVVERQHFTESQIADLEAAGTAIRKGVAELQVRMRQRFQEVFAAVDTAFGECFQALFGGGTARLELTAGEDVLSAGVEVIAQPPGKRANNLHTLSGGERALAAAALLFALLRVHPSPFCVLDEVDAALDEANVQRFAALLRAQAARTQFLVVTHNRGTMEIADALYGVTMVDNSVSQVASLRLAELPPSATDRVLN